MMGAISKVNFHPAQRTRELATEHGLPDSVRCADKPKVDQRPSDASLHGLLSDVVHGTQQLAQRGLARHVTCEQPATLQMVTLRFMPASLRRLLAVQSARLGEWRPIWLHRVDDALCLEFDRL